MVQDDEVIVVPAELRLIIVMEESQTIIVSAEWRVIEVHNNAFGQ